MKKKNQRKIALVLLAATFAFYGIFKFANPKANVAAQTSVVSPTPVPAPTAAEFNQAEALAKLREQIKGRENEPAEKVFKNLQLKGWTSAKHVVGAMEVGYARSLGVNCTHCHAPEKWESDEKPTKQIAREMVAMQKRINSELLKNIKNLKSENPIINCTTCHRGQIKPALNMPMPKS
ncbi:MAG TPA: c-type cytochrome [Pyrinomonadaceae bacterium]|jgi:hypothetical protein